MSDVRIVDRPEDMSRDGYLRLFIQPDGDVIVMVQSEGMGQIASVEFCSCGAGGGASPETIKALRRLAKAMAIDNADSMRRKDCVEYDGADLRNWELL